MEISCAFRSNFRPEPRNFAAVTNNRQFELSFRVLRIFVSFELSFVFGKIHRNSTNFVCITFAQYCTIISLPFESDLCVGKHNP